jgi:broad specificity phosphatase PhoE
MGQSCAVARPEAQPDARPELWLCRHGETEWSRDGRHTSHTDLVLTAAGVEQARRLVPALAGVAFDLVLTSPLRRASDTAVLLGFPDAIREPAVAEWDYGDFEGRTTAEIRTTVPGWTVWTHPSPGGERAEQVASRADRVIDRVLADATGRALVVSHGHFLRVLAARWVGEQAAFGRHLRLDTATLSVLGWERDARAIGRWNAEPQVDGQEPGRRPREPDRRPDGEPDRRPDGRPDRPDPPVTGSGDAPPHP